MKGVLLAKMSKQHSINHQPSAVKSFPSFLLNPYTIIRVILTTGLAIFFLQVFAQPVNEKQAATDYQKVITERAAKIVNVLGLTDSNKYNDVLSAMVNQYSQLNAIDEQTKAAIIEIKGQRLTSEMSGEAIKKAEEKKLSRVKQLHAEFIAHLQNNLAEEQIEKIKDGMTYMVFPITYAAYQDMLPNLTTEQKEKIYNWLKEARELAMDEGSSEKKHAMFGKYKGRINNYLSAAGYDMKKEGEEWQKRIKERNAKTGYRK